MWIKASGEITENTLQITTATASHLIISGEYCAISDAGIYAEGESLWKRIEEEVETIEFILLTHAHFDHVGAVPYLRSQAPHLRLLGGRETETLLKDAEYTRVLYEKNKNASEALGETMDLSFDDWHSMLQPDMTLSDGESFSLGGGVDIILIDTPGHTPDSVSYYVKPDAAFIGGDILGHYGGRDLVTPAFSGDYKTYLASLQKISSYDIQVLSLPHGGSLTGELVTRYLTELLVYSDQYREIFRKRLETGELLESVVKSVSLEWTDEGRFPDGPFRDSVHEAVHQMVASVRDS
jgi:2-aminobenzoylacetyl-CoA thioesterase